MNDHTAPPTAFFHYTTFASRRKERERQICLWCGGLRTDSHAFSDFCKVWSCKPDFGWQIGTGGGLIQYTFWSESGLGRGFCCAGDGRASFIQYCIYKLLPAPQNVTKRLVQVLRWRNVHTLRNLYRLRNQEMQWAYASSFPILSHRTS